MTGYPQAPSATQIAEIVDLRIGAAFVVLTPEGVVQFSNRLRPQHG